MTLSGPIRVVVVDDYEIVVQGLARMLEPFHERVAVVALAVDASPGEAADVALYDSFAASQGRDLDCAGLLRQTRARRLLIYSWNDDPQLVAASLEAGAHGYVAKQVTGEQLVAAIEAVHDGEHPLRGVDAEAVAEPGDWPGRREGLTEREAEMIALLTQGMTNDQIARTTYLSPNTVKAYLRTAYRKIDVTSRSRAVLWGLEHGFGLDRALIRRPPGTES